MIMTSFVKSYVRIHIMNSLLYSSWWPMHQIYACRNFVLSTHTFLLLFCLLALSRPRTLLHDKFRSKTSMWDDQPFTLWCWAPPSLCQGSTTILLWLPVALPPTCSPLHSMAQAVHHVHLWVSWSHGVWPVKMHLQDALIYGACSERPWNLVPDWSNRMGTHLRGK